MLQKELLAGESPCVQIFQNKNQLLIGKDKLFTFDHALPSTVAQVKCPFCCLLVHGQVTIIFVLSVCLSVCLFVCAEFFSAVFDPISIKLGHMLYVWV